MWTLVALVTATVLIPSVAIVALLQLGALKRAEDLPPHRQMDEVARPRGTQVRGRVPFRLNFEGLEHSEARRV